MTIGEGRRRPKRLSAETKWEIYLQVTSGAITQADAARRWGAGRVDGDHDPSHGQGRWVGCFVSQAGASCWGAQLGARRGPGGDRPAHRGGQGPGDRVGDRAGKIRLGLSGPVPARVPAEVKELVLATVDDAVAAGLSHSWAAGVWQVSDDRVHRWRARRRELGTLSDLAPGGGPVHGLLGWEIEEILAVAEEWGPTDRSHRKLAHRGSYEGRVWVAPSTFRRVLAAHGLVLAQRPPAPKQPRTPWPHWLAWEPNRIWIWDVTHFGRARRCVFAIVDMVSRYWVATLVSTEETSTQVRVVFDQALAAEGLDDLLTDERLDLDPDDPDRPILLAVSDNGPTLDATGQSTGTRPVFCGVTAEHGTGP